MNQTKKYYFMIKLSSSSAGLKNVTATFSGHRGSSPVEAALSLTQRKLPCLDSPGLWSKDDTFVKA